MDSDNLSSFLIKDCILCFEDVPCFIFNLIMKSGVFPVMWKISKICPVFKSSNKSNITDYRQIGIVPKIFESILAVNLYNHVSSSLVEEQHGFVKKRSTCTKLVAFT